MSNSRNTTPGPDRPGEPRPGELGDPVGSRQSPRDETEGSRHLAHELNNLLDGSLRNLSLALADLQRQSEREADAADDPLTDETARRLHTANDSMQQMAALLHQWMATERRPTGTPWEGASDGTLGNAIENARHQVEPLLSARNIALDVDVPAELADQPAGALQQVIINALRNALEAVDREGRIELRCTRAGEHIVLRIQDDGPGPSGMLPWTDEALPQPGTTTKPGGHGMGLAISRRIVESMGGTLRLDAAEEGGAVLTVSWKPVPSRTDPGPPA